MIYITYDNIYAKGYVGIRNKIMGQIQVLKKFFPRVYLTCYCGHMLYLLDDEQIIDKELAITKAACNEVLCNWLDKYKITKTYVRYGFSDQWFNRFLKMQKQKGIKSVLEIPTYPYDGELTYGRLKLEDSYYREYLHKYVDLVVTNSDSKNLWGMRCERLVNGVTLEANSIHEKQVENDKLVLIAVSGLGRWHGYERVIQGMHDYYEKDGKWKLYLKIVGDGPEKDYYHSLVHKYSLDVYVEFCGKLEGEDLDKQYDQSDIAVGSLGLFKTGIQDVMPIKGAEYCARGIPFICGYHDMRFTGKEPFILQVPNNSEPINMDKVIDFYKNITSIEGYQKEMRDYTSKYLTWDITMKPILNYFNEGTSV